MKNKRFSLYLLIIATFLLLMATGCDKREGKTNEKEAAESTSSDETAAGSEVTEIEGEFLLVSEEEGELIIYYNLNKLASIEELEKFIDLGYDFEAKPELYLDFDSVSEATVEEIISLLDKKSVRYIIIEDN